MEALTNFLSNNLQLLYILILAVFIGVEIIKNVPTVLHTPLMSGANALSGVVIMGAILVMLNTPEDNIVALAMGFVAVALGMINVVGGFAVTDRMLQMFKKKRK